MSCATCHLSHVAKKNIYIYIYIYINIKIINLKKIELLAYSQVSKKYSEKKLLGYFKLCNVADLITRERKSQQLTDFLDQS